jgi:hypothetical protein
MDVTRVRHIIPADHLALEDILPGYNKRFAFIPGMLKQGNGQAGRQGCMFQRVLAGNLFVVAQTQAAMKMMQSLSGMFRLFFGALDHE